MSPTYLQATAAALAVFSGTSIASPLDTTSCTDEEVSPATSIDLSSLLSGLFPPTPVPSGSGCANANREVACPVGNNTDYKSTDCTDFVLDCGTDRIGGDLPDSPQYPGSFAKCVDACASQEKCVAVVYSDGPCYLKGALAATGKLPGATGARKAAASAGPTATASAVETVLPMPAETSTIDITPSVSVGVQTVVVTVTASAN
ncbi:Carbohydrate-binding WSC domain-containing [Neofusicoccum parvum]|uniref:Carbohydrate-binding WSC domain-containing n=1 Tax=Neofusicoccum parvum TaxID=310453 RepID=A0ACB5S4S7_9PEZI|nr:Carbohydrate-binding WSC domain-containing [Neofusicoccum parvum]